MIRDDWSDWDTWFKPEHMATVWSAIEHNFPKYFRLYAGGSEEKAVALFGGAATANVSKKASPQQIRLRMLKRISEYENEAVAYREFLDPDSLEEYTEDVRQFGRDIERDMPIIRKLVFSQREELKEWQAKFKRLRSKRPGELLRVFTNQVEFGNTFQQEHTLVELTSLSSLDELGLGDFDAGCEDDKVAHLEGHARDDDGLIKFGKYHITGVISLGIITTVLWYHAPGHLAHRGRLALAGLYYLSGGDHFGTPSQTSEFLMYTANEYGSKIEHNFYYPYTLFSLYSLRLSRLLEGMFSDLKLNFDPAYRFVYTEDFLEFVTSHHRSEMKEWIEHDEYY